MDYVVLAEHGTLSAVSPTDTQPRLRRPALLRVGGYTMDAISGIVRWRGEPLHLGQQERELLMLLLRRAGQIVSDERLASLLAIPVGHVERRMNALKDSLVAEGVTWLPRKVDGCGYILWR